MRLVVQRVSGAEVRTAAESLARIGRGAVVLAGIGAADDAATVERMADRLLALRYFDDAEGRTNLSIADVEGELLVVSQFTLYADTRRGRRPSFTAAAPPDLAAALIERFVGRLRAGGMPVTTGRFGAKMSVELANDGPFTLVLDSERD